MKNETIRLAGQGFSDTGKFRQNYIITLLVFLAVFLLISPMQHQAAFSMASLITLYRFINSTLYGGREKQYTEIDRLPAGRAGDCRRARYLSTGILVIVLMIIIGAAAVIADRTYAGASAALTICTLLVYIIAMSVYMPMGFKLGYLKAVNINRFVFIGIFILFGSISMLIGSLGTRQGCQSDRKHHSIAG